MLSRALSVVLQDSCHSGDPHTELAIYDAVDLPEEVPPKK
jgi:hypothetical protein